MYGSGDNCDPQLIDGNGGRCYEKSAKCCIGKVERHYCR